MAAKKIVGYNFLHNHPGMEKQLSLPDDHVVVDRKDWEAVVRLFNENPSIIGMLP